MPPTTRKIILFSLIFDLVLLDQLSKWFVVEKIIGANFGKQPIGFFEWLFNAQERMAFTQIDITSFFNIVMVWNQGVSFGMFQQGEALGTLALIILALLITVIFTGWLCKSTSWFQGISLALIIGGAIGNVIDRIRFGAVIDFLDVHIGTLHWPAFNVADSCVVVGICLLIFYSIFLEEKTDETHKN